MTALRPLPKEDRWKDRHDSFAVLAIVKEWEREAAPIWWRVAITEPGGQTVEVVAPSGDTLAGWQAYAERYHPPGSAVTPVAPLPGPGVPWKKRLSGSRHDHEENTPRAEMRRVRGTVRRQPRFDNGYVGPRRRSGWLAEGDPSCTRPASRRSWMRLHLLRRRCVAHSA